MDFDEIRVITLPPPQTAAVNQLLREQTGWKLLETRVVERQLPLAEGPSVTPLVVYVMGHLRTAASVSEPGA